MCILFENLLLLMPIFSNKSDYGNIYGELNINSEFINSGLNLQLISIRVI